MKMKNEELKMKKFLVDDCFITENTEEHRKN